MVAVPLGGISGQGQFAAQWNSPAAWRVEVVVGNYHYIGVRNGNVEQHLPQDTHVPARVQWVLEHALRGCFASSRIDLAHRLSDGVVTMDDKHDQIILEPKEQSSGYKFWIVEKSTGLLKRSGFTVYSHYEPFGDLQIPRQIDLNEFNRDAEQFKLLSLQESAPAPDNTFVLKGAPEERLDRQTGFTGPQMNGLPHVVIAPEERARTPHFYVILAYTVGTDGKIYDARTVLSSGNTELDNDVLQTVRGMTYSPAMRNGVPVPFDIEYTYGYQGGAKLWTSIR